MRRGACLKCGAGYLRESRGGGWKCPVCGEVLPDKAQEFFYVQDYRVCAGVQESAAY